MAIKRRNLLPKKERRAEMYKGNTFARTDVLKLVLTLAAILILCVTMLSVTPGYGYLITLDDQASTFSIQIPDVSGSGSSGSPMPAPAMKKPVFVTVADENGEAIPGVTVVLKNQRGRILASETLEDTTFSCFASPGEYTVELQNLPEGCTADVTEQSVDVSLTAGEKNYSIKAKSIQSSHNELCTHSPSYVETYKVLDDNTEISAYCFNQNYDAPKLDDPDCTYRKLVGTPENLALIAQNELPGMSAQELYDHVLSIIYHRDYIKEKYGFDDVLTDYLMNMALKNFTDGNIDSFKTTDENGNNLVLRANGSTGAVVYDENGNYQFRPGGTTLGSIVGHGKNDHKKDSSYVFPQSVKDAWHEMVEMTDYPDDYFLYIYYPKNFMTKEAGIASGWTVPARYANMYYADAYQCLMTGSTVEPVRKDFVITMADPDESSNEEAYEKAEEELDMEELEEAAEEYFVKEEDSSDSDAVSNEEKEPVLPEEYGIYQDKDGTYSIFGKAETDGTLESVTILIKDGDKVLKEFSVSEKDDWEFRITGIPTSSFSVEIKPIDGYSFEYKDFIITVTKDSVPPAEESPVQESQDEKHEEPAVVKEDAEPMAVEEQLPDENGGQ